MSTADPARTTTHLPTGTWRADYTHSYAAFAIRAVGTFRASFKTVEAVLTVDRDGSLSLVGSVPFESLQLKNDQQKAHLSSSDFFDAERHPTLSFASTSITRDGSALELAGELTMRGQTRSIVARGTLSPPVTALDGATRLGMEFETVVDRTDFGISWNAPLPTGQTVIGTDVTITVDLDLVLSDPAETA